MSQTRSTWETARPRPHSRLVCTLVALLVGSVVAGAQGPAPPPSRSDAGPVERRSQPITPENPIPRRLSSVAPVYPAEAQGSGAFGNVTVQMTLDETGTTAEVRPVATGIRVSAGSGSNAAPEPLVTAFADAAVSAARLWVYEAPYQGPVTFQATFVFAAGLAEGTVFSVQQSTPSPSQPPLAPLMPGLSVAGPGTPSPLTPIRVGGQISAPMKTRDVKPAYPAIAQSAKVSGIVVVETVVGTDGRVTNARIMRSIPLLDAAALEAVRQWEFRPTLLNGQPTPIVMSVTVNFLLDQ